LEEIRLRTIVVAVLKVGQTDAHQPKRLLWLKVHPFSELQRDVSQLLASSKYEPFHHRTSEEFLTIFNSFQADSFPPRWCYPDNFLTLQWLRRHTALIGGALPIEHDRDAHRIAACRRPVGDVSAVA
jgi:hypothetical protein